MLKKKIIQIALRCNKTDLHLDKQNTHFFLEPQKNSAMIRVMKTHATQNHTKTTALIKTNYVFFSMFFKNYLFNWLSGFEKVCLFLNCVCIRFFPVFFLLSLKFKGLWHWMKLWEFTHCYDEFKMVHEWVHSSFW